MIILSFTYYLINEVMLFILLLIYIPSTRILLLGHLLG